MSIQGRTKYPTWLGITLGSITLAVILFGVITISRRNAALYTKTAKELVGIAQVKAKQVSDWRSEQIYKAQQLSSDPSLTASCASVIDGKRGYYQDHLLAVFRQKIRTDKLSSIILVNQSGRVLLSTDLSIDSLPQSVMPELSTVITNRQPLFDEPMADDDLKLPHVHIISPVLTNDQHAIGAIILTSLSSDYLLPVIHKWPLPTDSGEFAISFGGKTRKFASSPSNSNSIRIADTFVPWDHLAETLDTNQPQVIQVTDYRGKQVLVTAAAVPHTTWALVAKIDSSEALRHLQMSSQLMILHTALITLVLLIIGISSLMVYREKQYARAFSKEQELLAVTKHYQALMHNSSDAMIITDGKLHIIDINKTARDLFGYTHYEALALDIDQIIKDPQPASISDIVAEANDSNDPSFTARCISKNNSAVSINGIIHRINTQKDSYIHFTIIDMTKQSQEQQKIRTSLLLFRRFMDNLPGMAYIENASGDFEYSSTSLDSLIGIDVCDENNREAFKQHPLYQLLSSDVNQRQQILIEGTITSEFSYQHDSIVSRYHLTRFFVNQDPSLGQVGGIVLDITQTKAAEKELNRLTHMYATLGRVNESIIRASSWSGLFADICEVAVVEDKCELAWIGLYDDSKTHINNVTMAGNPKEYVNLATAPSGGFLSAEDPAFTALRQGKAVFRNNMAYEALSPSETLLFTHNIHSAGAFPIIHNDDIIGICAFYHQDPYFYCDQELSLLEELSRDVSYALDTITRAQQQQQLADIVEHSELVTFKWGLTNDWPVLFVSDNVDTIGFTKQYFADGSHNYYDVIHADDRARIVTQWEHYMAISRGLYTSRYRIVDQYGACRHVEERTWIIQNPDDSAPYALGIVTDVSAQVRSEQLLKESEQRYRSMFDNLNTVMFIINPETGAIVDANPAAESFYGWSKDQLRSMRIMDINTLSTSEVKGNMVLASGRQKNIFRFKHKLADSTIRDVEVLSFPIKLDGKIYLYSIVIDITAQIDAEERRQKEEQKRLQGQKLETIGRLSSGIAHDFNNLLTVITGFVDIMMDMSDESNPLYPELQEVRRASDQAASLTKQLLAFSRKQTLKKSDTDINKLVSSSSRMFTRLVGEDIKVEMILCENPPIACVDDGQIGQVVLNLVTNARDAMPNGGTLKVITNLVTIGSADELYAPEAAAGTYVMVTIADTGLGMDEQTRTHIFEPFYTTKTQGKGTGLGLATCDAILKQHDGWISVNSALGVGSEFHLYLPAVAATTEQVEEANTTHEPPHGHGERIMLVEDEVAVQRMAVKVLERYGYTVIPASDGEAALDLYKNDPTAYNLVMSDVVMPNMDGLELAKHIHELNPSQKILLNSGYTDDKVNWDDIASQHLAFINKPFTVDKLVTTVNEILTS